MNKKTIAISFASSLLYFSSGFCIPEYEWIGGLSSNSLITSGNWNPLGPPGVNEIALFETTENPPVLYASDSLSIGSVYFGVSQITLENLGTLTIGDVENASNVVTTFNLGSGSSLEIEGTLASEGLVEYNANAATFLITGSNSSNAIVSLSGGSLLSIDSPTVITAISSQSADDQIILNTNLTIQNTDDRIINGVLSGSGDFVKQGSGSTTLNGDSTFSGTLSIVEGVLAVNGSFSSASTCNVTSGTLKGTGTLNQITVASGGTVAPGNSVGTLHTGTVSFASGSNYQVEIDPLAASLLDVSGSAALAGTVNVMQDSGSYGSSGRYLILQTTGGISGGFDSNVLGGLPRYLFSLQQTSNELYLLYTNLEIPSSGLSGNALKVANYLNENANNNTLQLLTGLSESSLSKALNSISPARNGFSTYITEQLAFSLSGLLSTHLDEIKISQKSSSAKDIPNALTADSSNSLQTSYHQQKDQGWSVWGSGFGQYAHQTASLQNPSFDFISEAALVGVDYKAQKRNLLGSALGYAHTHYNDSHRMGNGNINYYFLSFYGNGYLGNFYYSPAVWGVFNETKNQRNISFSGFFEKAHSHIFAWQFIPHLEIGYDVRFSWGNILPFSSADWAISWQRGYSEKGASPFNAKQQANNSSMVQSETGLKISQKWNKNWGAFFLKEKLSYIFEKPYGVGTVTSSFIGMPQSFTVEAVQNNLNLAGAGVDFLFVIGKKSPTSLSLSYQGEFGAHYWSNSLQLNINKDF